MSLVHEALKKVQEERSRRSAPRAHEPAFLASGGRALPAPSRAVLLGGILILLAVFAAAWRFGLFPSSGVKLPAAHPPIQAPVQAAGQGGPFRDQGPYRDQVGTSDSRQTPPKAAVPEIPVESRKVSSTSAFDEGVERFKRREWDAALERFQAAREAGVQPARAWLYTGKIAAERGDSSKAEEAYRKALSVDPGSWEAANNLGALLDRNGRTREARPVLESGLAANPNEPTLHLNLAVVLEKEGDRAGAKRHYEKFLQHAVSGQAGIAERVRRKIESF